MGVFDCFDRAEEYLLQIITEDIRRTENGRPIRATFWLYAESLSKRVSITFGSEIPAFGSNDDLMENINSQLIDTSISDLEIRYDYKEYPNSNSNSNWLKGF